MLSGYYDRRAIDAKVMRGRHRAVVGGLWDEMGRLQADFLIAHGLLPHHAFLDIGCGSLRAGVKLVRYLDADHYFGTDLNESLLAVGYDIELASEGLTAKLPRSSLVADGEFDFSWCPRPIDYALAQSVFTHLPLGLLRRCLERLAGIVKPGGKFFLTFYEIPNGHPADQPYRHQPGGILSRGDADPYHHRAADVAQCARLLPWRARSIGEWGHPRAQRMMEFVRTEDARG